MMRTAVQSRQGILFMAIAAMVAAILWTLPSSGPAAASGDQLADRLEGMSPREQADFLLAERQGGLDNPESNFLLGVAMYSLGEMDSALTFFSRAVHLDSTYTKAYVNLAIIYDSKRQTFEAESMYKRAIALNPDDELALCHLGFMYYSQKKYELAIDYYQQALAVNPRSAQAHYNLGMAFADAKIFKEAIHEWEQVIELDPDSELGKTAAENVQLIKQYLEVDTP